MQLPRQRGEARAKGSGRRTSYRHKSRPLTKVAWSTRSPEGGFAEVVLTRVLLRRLPESVRMRLPPPCSAAGTAAGKAESRCLHGPDLPRRRKSEGSKATSSLREPHRPAVSARSCNPCPLHPGSGGMWPENRPQLGQGVNPPPSGPTACMSRRSRAGIRSDCGQGRFSDLQTETPGCAKGGEASGYVGIRRNQDLRQFRDWSGWASLAS
ncbi:hypothetical protein N658DRAFT_55580 [Parathielavia hyrcaniae]|uniref:Uncharacterized protein n=1 Tax=Parathielavia hyrcaniae TaxID=113614 RepID=A0AAN6PSC7_9PEZI|nr:hypothetical protein N658DRAFT_55580 [Parathielavia hyrcaniae]